MVILMTITRINNKYLKIITTTIFSISLIMNLVYFLYRPRLVSISVLVYQFIFRAFLEYKLGISNTIVFLIFIIFYLSLVLVIHSQLKRSIKVGAICFSLYLISLIPFVDTFNMGL